MNESGLVVIIPAYQEEAHVAGVIEKTRQHVPEADIVVVNDGSRDRTAAVARAAGARVINLPYNMGYGAALQTGYKYAKENGYQVLAQIDADGQHDPRFIPEMVKLVRSREADVVIGSRFLGDNDYRAPVLNRLGMLVFGRIASWAMGQAVTDATSGYQVLSRRAFCYCAGDVYPTDFADADVLIMLHRAGFRIREVAVRMNPRNKDRSRYLSMYSFLTPPYYLFKMSLSTLVALMRASGDADKVLE